MNQINTAQTPLNSSDRASKVVHFPEIAAEVELEPIEQLDPIQAEIIETESLTFPQPQQDQQNTDWVAIARKLRQQNRELIRTVVQLEQALAESQEQLEDHSKLKRNVEALLTQKIEELNEAQEKIGYLLQQLETTQQTNQSQQLLLDNLSQQLETAQGQAAHLERECTSIQEQCTGKTQKILVLEQQVLQLRARLHRQQRYTLQYKAALDQCLELPQEPTEIQTNCITPVNVTPKVVSIQPWSSSLTEVVLNFEQNFPPVESPPSEPITPPTEALDIPEVNKLSPDPIDELFTTLVPSETVAELPSPSPTRPNPLSHVISPNRDRGKQSAKIVDIPRFLRNRSPEPDLSPEPEQLEQP